MNTVPTFSQSDNVDFKFQYLLIHVKQNTAYIIPHNLSNTPRYLAGSKSLVQKNMIHP